MSNTQQTTIMCDVHGCENSLILYTADIADAESTARSYGWRCVPVGDFCPDNHTMPA